MNTMIATEALLRAGREMYSANTKQAAVAILYADRAVDYATKAGFTPGIIARGIAFGKMQAQSEVSMP